MPAHVVCEQRYPTGWKNNVGDSRQKCGSNCIKKDVEMINVRYRLFFCSARAWSWAGVLRCIRFTQSGDICQETPASGKSVPHSIHIRGFATSIFSGIGFLQSALITQKKPLSVDGLPIKTPIVTEALFYSLIFSLMRTSSTQNNCTLKGRLKLVIELGRQYKVFAMLGMLLFFNLRCWVSSESNFQRTWCTLLYVRILYCWDQRRMGLNRYLNCNRFFNRKEKSCLGWCGSCDMGDGKRWRYGDLLRRVFLLRHRFLSS